MLKWLACVTLMGKFVGSCPVQVTPKTIIKMAQTASIYHAGIAMVVLQCSLCKKQGRVVNCLWRHAV